MALLHGPNTQYNDMTGKVAMDFWESSPSDLAKACGVDTAKYMPIAFDVSPAVDAADTNKQGLSVTFYVVDFPEVYSEKIEALLKGAEREVSTHRFEASMSYQAFFRHIKRFELQARFKTIPDHVNISYDENEHPKYLGWK